MQPKPTHITCKKAEEAEKAVNEAQSKDARGHGGNRVEGDDGLDADQTQLSPMQQAVELFALTLSAKLLPETATSFQVWWMAAVLASDTASGPWTTPMTATV